MLQKVRMHFILVAMAALVAVLALLEVFSGTRRKQVSPADTTL